MDRVPADDRKGLGGQGERKQREDDDESQQKPS